MMANTVIFRLQGLPLFERWVVQVSHQNVLFDWVDSSDWLSNMEYRSDGSTAIQRQKGSDQCHASMGLQRSFSNASHVCNAM